MPTTTRQLARLAGISESSLRNYTHDYAELLSPAGRGDLGARAFSDDDVQIICTIAALRKEDVPRAEIIARLQRGDIVIDATPSPQQATPSQPPTAQEGHSEALTRIDVQPMLLARIEAIERHQQTLLRAATLWGALWGAVAALVFAGFVVWVLWLVVAY